MKSFTDIGSRLAIMLLLCLNLNCDTESSDLRRALNERENKNMRTIRLSPYGLTIMVPENVVPVESAPFPYLCFENELNNRSPRCLSIVDIPFMPDTKGMQILQLPEGRRVYYETERADVGSGGPEENLTGYLGIGNRFYKISAVSQSKGRKPDVSWAIPLIETIRSEQKSGG